MYPFTLVSESPALPSWLTLWKMKIMSRQVRFCLPFPIPAVAL